MNVISCYIRPLLNISLSTGYHQSAHRCELTSTTFVTLHQEMGRHCRNVNINVETFALVKEVDF